MAGIEITDTRVHALLPGRTPGRPPRTTTRPLRAPGHAEVATQLRAALAALADNQPAVLTGVGIALPTTADQATADLLAAATDIPTLLVRPAQALAAAESRHGAARGAHRTAAVLIDTTLTAALTTTATADAGNVGAGWGHTVIEMSGRHCSCGARGCLAAYVSAPAILSRHRQMANALTEGERETTGTRGTTWPGEDGGARVALAEVVASAEHSAPARWVLSQTAAYLGAGIANLANLVDPDCVVIGGWAGLLLGADLLPEIRTAVAAHTPDIPGIWGSSTPAAVRLSRLGPDAVALGAAGLAASHLPDLPDLPTTSRPLAASSAR